MGTHKHTSGAARAAVKIYSRAGRGTASKRDAACGALNIQAMADIIDIETGIAGLVKVCMKAKELMESCLNDNGSWDDCPAANKRELLEMACTAIAKAK